MADVANLSQEARITMTQRTVTEAHSAQDGNLHSGDYFECVYCGLREELVEATRAFQEACASPMISKSGYNVVRDRYETARRRYHEARMRQYVVVGENAMGGKDDA
jgi:hypothetical protein